MDREHLKIHLASKAFKDDRGFWKCWAPASDGSQFLGRGANYAQAVDDVIDKVQEHERFLALPAADQLREIMKKPRILDNDKERCIRLLAELVLGENRENT